MPDLFKNFLKNKPIPPKKRVFSPVISAVVSFFLPGSAQMLNGQVLKGASILLVWFVLYSIALINSFWYNVVKIAQYIIMVMVSSDAYFIASRMKLGEIVRTWSILFFNIQPPSESAAAERAKGGVQTLITGVTVVDGTGAPAFQADVLIEGAIVGYVRPHIDSTLKDYTIIEGEGRILIPGLISPCCCGEASVFGSEENTQAVRQGITTEILGQNGQSLGPISVYDKENAAKLFSAVHGKQIKEHGFDNTGLYLMELDRQKYPARLESMVGYSTLRTTVLGNTSDAPDEEGIAQLCARVESVLNSGAKGISFSFAYPPCNCVGNEELRAVFTKVAKQKGLINAQIPVGEGTMLPALQRLGQLAHESGVSLMVTNLHALGEDRKKAEDVCKLIREFRERGVDITLAVTGLEEQVIGLAALTPEEMWTDLEDGVFYYSDAGAERTVFLNRSDYKLSAVGGASALTVYTAELDGVPLVQLAAEHSCTPVEMILHLLDQTDGCAMAVLRTDDSAFLSRLLKEPYTYLCTDSMQLGQADFTIPHILGRYINEEQVVSMEELIHRSTMSQAARFGLYDRGLIREGMVADLVLLQPEAFPTQLNDAVTRGVVKVWVNGSLQYDSEPVMGNALLPKSKFFGIRMGA